MALAGSVERVERPPEDELLLDLWLKKDLRISDEFLGYLSPNGGVLVPLGLLCELTGIAVEVDAAEGTAQGFVLQESERFHLDIPAGVVTLSGVDAPFLAELVELHHDDIYVETALLNQWLPLELQIDLLNSTAHLYPEKPLPMQERWAREARFQRLASQRQAREAASYPEQANPYLAASGPFIDESLDLRISRDKDGASSKSMRHATLATMDLAYWNSRLFASGNEDELFADKRLTFSRRNPEGGLLGPLDAREVEFGAFSADSIPLLHRGSAATGLTVGNFPLESRGQFSSQDFFGDALPGWEVEIYRNDVLLDYQLVAEDGRYRFDDVPLLYGMNVFRIVTYGPQGQKRSEIQRFNIARPLVQPGEHQYRFTVAQTEEGLERVSAQYRTALGARTTLDTTLTTWQQDASVSTRGTADWKTQALLGVQSYYDSWFGSAHVALDADGEVAAQLGVQGRFGDLDISFEHREIGSFTSERYSLDSTALKRSDKLNLNGSFRPGRFFSNISYALSGLREERADDRVLTEIGNRISVFHPRLSVSNELSLTLNDTASNSSKRADGILRMRAPLNGWRTGGEMTYSLKPERALNKLGLTVDRQLDHGYMVRLGLNHHMPESTNDASISLSKTFGSFTLSSSLFASDSGVLSAGVNLTTALGRNNRGRWTQSGKPIAGSGAVSVAAFLDRNRNGVRDQGEEGVGDIGLRLNGTSPRVATRDDEQTTLYGLTPDRWNSVSLVSGDIDPAWVPSKPGVRIMPRPGTTPSVDFPLVIVGEIDGTVTLLSDGRAKAAPGVFVQLLDSRGEVVKQEKTAYDGFYLFPEVAPGNYRVRVDPTQIERLQLQPARSESIEVGDDGPIISGIDLQLRRLGEDVPPTTPDSSTATATPPPRMPEEAVTGTWVVQIGAFSSRENAERLTAKLQTRGIAMRPVEVAEVGGKILYRVLAGPAATREEAEAMLDLLRKPGRAPRMLVRTLVAPGN